MRYFLEFSYLGAPFHGWQSQPNAVSVQSVIEDALSTLFRRKVPVVGAGRTDAGVNARRMFAHFDAEEHPLLEDGGRRLCLSLNNMCGPAISVSGVRRVKDDAHARFDATRRTYKYFVSFAKTPFRNSLSWKSTSPLDVDAMNAAARILLETDDFTSFAKLHSDARTNICRVSEAVWTLCDDEYGTPGAVFTITADRFLRNMVRAVVGTLVDVGRGKMSADRFRAVIDARDRCAAGTSMPGEALFLWDVAYPEDIFL